MIDVHKNSKKREGWRGSVINMSLVASSSSEALDTSLEAAFQAGIPMAAAAGNDGKYVGSRAPCTYVSSHTHIHSYI